MMTKAKDIIFLRNLSLAGIVGKEAWQRSGRLQPVIVDLKLHVDVTPAAQRDDLEYTLNYGTLCKNLTKLIEGPKDARAADGPQHWANIKDLANSLGQVPFDTARGTNQIAISFVELTITLPKGVLLAEGGVGLSTVFPNSTHITAESRDDLECLFIRQLKLNAIIGVNSHERLEKQQVVVDLTLRDLGQDSQIWTSYHDLVRKVAGMVDASDFRSLEALAIKTAQTCFSLPGFDTVTVSIQKPSALSFVAGAGIELTRTRQQLESFTWMLDIR